MLLVIDNYDSFVYNLVQYFGELGEKPSVHRNDRITVREAEAMRPERIVISPGPCTPAEAGVSNDIIRAFAGKVPILGVCLGHQCIAAAFGGEIVRAGRLMHGKTSMIVHSGKGLFENIPNPFEAIRYHSLLVRRDNLPACLEITAETEEQEIMALRHKKFPIWGVQFHPESILTREGMRVLQNFVRLRR
jgi:anthranilate synthase/aminodeoxychorismate synthase-like glutamine amidotransferase